MVKQYISVERTLSPRPRSKRRRETGEGGSTGNITVVQNGGGSSSAPVSGDGHTHDNKSTLDKLGIDGEGYVTVTDWQENGDGDLEKTTSKSKAGYADRAQNLAEDSTDWQTIDGKIEENNRLNDEKYLRKDQDDETLYSLGIGQDLTVGRNATIGGKTTTDDLEADDAEINNDLTVGRNASIGGKTTTDDLEADDAIVNNNLSVGNNLGVGGNASVLGKTTTHELDTGDAVFRNRASSLDFISGFVAGTGWGITKEQIENALGVVETKYHLEIDKLTVRGQMRVYEMIISQLLGENDNRVFTAMMEVDHYDAATGRVYFDNKGGRLYNPFRHDDYIKVQQYNPAASNGYVIKSYELLIDGIYSGYENGERVDWVTFRNFSPSTDLPSEVIAEGDTFTRWDNKTDAERKGLISITTVGPQTPYIDIMHGAKTDPDNALKGRIGNLSGIRHHLFGWLDGFGEYLINLYAVGDFRLRNTGESLDAKIEALRGLMSTNYAQTVYDITEDGNYLKNATFASMDGNGNFRHWAISADNVVFYTLAGLPLYENTALMGNVARVARLVEMDGKKVLHIVNNTLTQANADIKKPGTHKVYQEPTTETTENYTTAKDKLYLSIKMKVVKSGRLTIGFPASESVEGSLPKVALDVEKSNDWQILEWDGTWDGIGNFVIGFTGEAYFSLLSLTDEPLDEFKKEYNTQIIQTAKNITLTASRVTATETSIAQLQVTADGITASVTALRQDMDGNVQTLSSRISQTASDITAAVSRITQNEEYIAQLQITADGLTTTVGTLATREALSGLRTELLGELGDLDDDLDDLTNVYGTFAEQTDRRISAIAGKWDNNGNLIGYSTTTQTSSMIAQAVTNFENGRFSELRQTVDGLTTTVGTLATREALESLSGDLDDFNDNLEDWKTNVYGTFAEQTDTRIRAITAKWDNNGNLIGYSTTSQTAEAISSAVRGLESDMQESEARFDMTARRLSMEVTEVSEGCYQLLENTDFISGKMEAWTTAAGSISSLNNYLDQNSYYCYNSSGEKDFLQQTLWDGSGVIEKIARNRWYTFSFYAKGTGKLRTFIYPGCVDQSEKCYVDGTEAVATVDGFKEWTLSSSWVRHTYTFKTIDNSIFLNNSQTGSGIQRLLFRLQGYANAYICMPRLEMGTEVHGYKEDVLGLKRTGIDIENGRIDVQADDFILRNNAGDQTIGADAGGNLFLKGALMHHKVMTSGATASEQGRKLFTMYDSDGLEVPIGNTVKTVVRIALDCDTFILTGVKRDYTVYLPPASFFPGVRIKIVNGTYSGGNGVQKSADPSRITFSVAYRADTEELDDDAYGYAKNNFTAGMPFVYSYGANDVTLVGAPDSSKLTSTGNDTYGLMMSTTLLYTVVELMATENKESPGYYAWMVIEAR